MRIAFLIPLLLSLFACGPATQVDRFAQTLTITASATVVADDGLYVFAKLRANEIARTAETEAEGLQKIAELEAGVAKAHAGLVVIKGLLKVGLRIVEAVRAGGDLKLITTWLPTLETALQEVNKALEAIGAATAVPKLPSTGGTS